MTPKICFTTHLSISHLLICSLAPLAVLTAADHALHLPDDRPRPATGAAAGASSRAEQRSSRRSLDEGPGPAGQAELPPSLEAYIRVLKYVSSAAVGDLAAA